MNFANFNNVQYVLGNGSIEKIKDYADKRIGLVIDEKIISALNLGDKLYKDILAGSNYEILCNVEKEPDMAMVNEAVEKTRAFAPEYIIAIGGGSVMDTAKALWLFLELPHYSWEEATKAYEVEPFKGKCSLIAIPTTSGTGSETTGCSVIKNEKKEKCMILSNEIIPKLVIMDFDLVKSIPKSNIAFSGTDALAHALEAGVSQISSKMVKMFCAQASVEIIKKLAKSYNGDMQAREAIHVAATMAGSGISNSITGMAHGMDQAGGDFYKPHGLMTGLLLPYTMRYLIPNPFYTEVAEQLGIEGTDEEKQSKLVEKIWQLYDEINMPKTLKEAGIPESEYLEKIPGYITRAKADANILFAPKQPSEAELEKLYKEFYYGI